MIDVNKIVNILADELTDSLTKIKNTEPEIFSKVNYLYVGDEQAFYQEEVQKPDAVYVLVKFGSGNVNYGVEYITVSLLILGNENQVKPSQYLFNKFVSDWTTKGLKSVDLTNTIQVWDTPRVSSNFNEVKTGFRNLFEVVGTVILGNQAHLFDEFKYFDTKTQSYTENLPFLSFQDGSTNSLKPQPFYNSDGFARSEVNFTTYAFTISTYLVDNQLIADCLSARGFIATEKANFTSDKRPDSLFKFKIGLSNGWMLEKEYKLQTFVIGERIGEVISVTLSFSL